MTGSENEKCICELCECGNHKCPHQEGRLIGLDDVNNGKTTEYRDRFFEKQAERTKSIKPKQSNLANEGALQTETTHFG
uniref:Uncharacterized protein n=1 Tax=Acrobeloides nanus TaxID=290746 RepID=A0A914C0Y1_9BILA